MIHTQPRILVVEDDARIRAELQDALGAAGYTVELRASLQQARQALTSNFDLMILDLGLPDGDGLDLCRDLRAAGRSLPVIMLTARETPNERVRGLDVGADDYLTKPFHLPELVARVRSILRRSGRSPEAGRRQCGTLWADPGQRTAGRGDLHFQLTRREFDLLYFLLGQPGRTWTREQLLDHVWGPEYDGEARTVDLHIRRLRAQIEEDPSDPRHLRTVWGVGYRMAEEESA